MPSAQCLGPTPKLPQHLQARVPTSSSHCAALHGATIIPTFQISKLRLTEINDFPIKPLTGNRTILVPRQHQDFQAQYLTLLWAPLPRY